MNKYFIEVMTYFHTHNIRKTQIFVNENGEMNVLINKINIIKNSEKVCRIFGKLLKKFKVLQINIK